MAWFTDKKPFDKPGPLKLAQISDCHLSCDGGLFHGIDAEASLRRVLQRLSQTPFDCVFVTGDISQDHTDASYQLLGRLCEQYLPNTCVARLPGNHDELACIDLWLSQSPMTKANHFTWQNWHILQLNSKGPTPSGWICEQHFSQIYRCLADIPDDHHVGVFCHHHPVPIGAYIDKHILTNGERLLACLTEHPQVKFLAHGHVHQQDEKVIQGPQGNEIKLLATPSTSMQFAAGSKVRANDDLGPAYRTFELSTSGQWQSEVIWLGKG